LETSKDITTNQKVALGFWATLCIDQVRRPWTDAAARAHLVRTECRDWSRTAAR